MMRNYRVRYEDCIGRAIVYDGFCETSAKTKRGILHAIAKDFVRRFHTDICELLMYETQIGLNPADSMDELVFWNRVSKLMRDWKTVCMRV